MTTQELYLNRKEAAEFSGTTVNAVKNAVDKRIVPEFEVESGGAIDARDVALLVLLPDLVSLPVREKRAVRDWLFEDDGPSLRLTAALLVQRPLEAVQAVRDAEAYAERRQRWVVSDPDIRGGEPVIRGSRVSVYSLAARIAAGEADNVLDEDFPHITKEARDVAVRYARTHPRAGRPRRKSAA